MHATRVLAWHKGQTGLKMTMMLALVQAGALRALSHGGCRYRAVMRNSFPAKRQTRWSK
jgi:hypothetical protein